MKLVEYAAIRLHTAYHTHGPNPWKTSAGRDVPRWEATPEEERDKWHAAATVILNATLDDLIGISEAQWREMYRA